MVFIPSSHLDEPEHERRSMWAPAVGSIDWQLDAVRRCDQQIAELNAAPLPNPESVVGEAAPETPTVKPRKLTELQRAKTWLQELLDAGPMTQREVEKLARKAGIRSQTLKRARQALRVKSTGKPRQPWVWSLLRVKAKPDSEPEVNSDHA